MSPAAVLRSQRVTSFNGAAYGPITDCLTASAIINAAVGIVVLCLNQRFWHWFMIPTMMCGTVCLAVLLHAARQHRAFTDPTLLIAALGYHDTCLAPLLQVLLNYRILALPFQPADYRPWLGRLALVNLVGIAIFAVVFSQVVSRAERLKRGPFRVSEWVLDRNRLMVYGTLFLLASVLLQAYVYVDFGGLGGYMEKYLRHPEAWLNMGWLLAIAESAPITAVLVAAGLRNSRMRRTPLWLLFACGAAFLVALMFFGGFRGSRANIVVKSFFAAGIAHLAFRPLSNKILLFMGALAAAGSYGYGFYKDFGLQGLQAMLSSESRTVLAGRSGRSFETVLISDTSRSDIECFVLQELESGRPMDFGYGRTYLGALSLLIPRSIWPERLPTKLKWTTELEGGVRSSRMYGQLGEAMLNFGYLGIPLAFLAMGFLIGNVAALSRRLTAADPRWMLIPGLVVTSACMVIQDSDNILYFVFQFTVVPWVLVWLSTVRREIVSGPYWSSFGERPFQGRVWDRSPKPIAG